MKNPNIAELQRRAQKLMEISSDQSDPGFLNQEIEKVLGKLNRSLPKNNQQPQILQKCVSLIQQNKTLKQQLAKEQHQNMRIHSELHKLRQHNTILESKFHKQQSLHNDQTLRNDRHIRGNDEKQYIKRIAKMESQLQSTDKKCKALLEMLRTQKLKNKKLTKFIHEKIPGLQQKLGTLATKIDVKLEDYYRKEYQL